MTLQPTPEAEINQIRLKFSFTQRQLDDMKPGQEIEIPLTDDAKQALVNLLNRSRINGAKRIVDSITKEHDLIKEKKAITLAEMHGYFYAVRDAHLELAELQAPPATEGAAE